MGFMNTAAVNLEQVGFIYPGQSSMCIKNMNLEIGAGESFGLFGPNGAGKTTLMHLMTGLLTAVEGSIHLMGRPVKKHDKSSNRLFGFVPQDFSFYEELSPVENLEFFGAWSGLSRAQVKKRIDELLEVLSLTDVRNKAVHKFSGGMKRRVNLAIGVIHHPEILFLDEPTVGVDVQTRHAIINYLKQLNQEGTTLIYTSHQLNEAEELCNKIALINSGRIIAHDSLQNLLEEHREDGLEGLFISLTGKEVSFFD
jgi:ABC-2 type transport system ATP-binding protein